MRKYFTIILQFFQIMNHLHLQFLLFLIFLIFLIFFEQPHDLCLETIIIVELPHKSGKNYSITINIFFCTQYALDDFI